SCRLEAAWSEGSKRKVVLSLLTLRMDLINAACSIFTTLSVKVAWKVLPGLVLRSGARLRPDGELGREDPCWNDSDPVFCREQVANSRTAPSKTSSRTALRPRFMNAPPGSTRFQASRGAMLRSPKARVKGRKAGSLASSFWFLMSALAGSFVGGLKP